MNIPKFAIDNYQFTITAFVFLLVLGISSYFGMPRSEDPVMDLPAVTVIAIYPGATPKDVESQVADPIEEAVNELDDVVEIVTDISDGVAVIQIEFTFGVDPKDKFDEVQAKVTGLSKELPDDLYSLEVREQSTTTVAIFQLALVSSSASYAQLEEEADRLKKIVEKVDGVRKMKIEAYPDQEVRIALQPIKMKQLNVSLDDIERAFQSNNANIPGGAIKISQKLFNIKTSGSYSDVEEIKNTVVGSYQGKIIYLKSIADVFMDYQDERWVSRFNGERSLVLTIQQKEGYNIFDVANPIQEKIAATPLADDVRVEYVYDQSAGVEDRVSGFTNNLLQGILLVGVIILFVLGFRSASVVMIAIPTSILIGLWVVNYFELGLQQMSIAGLVVALGLLVDNSIAVIENTERFMAEGLSARAAAIKGTSQLVTPLLSATLTTVLAFVPIIMMPETTGEFIKALPVTVIAVLAASFLGAISLTPFLASRFLRGKKISTEGPAQSIGLRTLQRFVTGPYRRALQWSLNHKALTIGIALTSFVGSLLLFPYVGVSFFPKAEKPIFRITISLPNGSNLDATDEVVSYVEEVLNSKEDVAYYASNIGHGNPRIYYNTFPRNFASNYGEILVQLKAYEVADFYALLDDLRSEFGQYANARIDVREFVQGPPTEAPIAIKIYGNDLDKLQDYAQQVERVASQHPGAINIDNSLRTSSTDIYFNINRDKAMLFGVPIFQIDKTIRSFVNGTTIGTLRNDDADEYPVVMRYDFDERFQLDDFDKIQVRSLSNHDIPLGQLASMEFTQAPTQIGHLNTDRVASVLGDVAQGYILDDVVADLSTQLEALDWAEGYSFEFKGELEEREKSFGGLGIASLMALILIMGVLIIQFRSFSQPLIIFSALPLAIIGSILALFIVGISFSFTAFIGLVSLIGIAINNSIVLVDFANRMREEGKSIDEAAQLAGEVRFVPIVLTTLTTILGLLPLTLAGGSMWAPMGWTIIGGLLTSTTFVLLLVPILYQLFSPAVLPAEQ
ncbi:MAG: efflux RND transporter permease subunit [Bacteroidota bacterium]